MCKISVQVLRLLVKLYEGIATPDWLSISQCLAFLDDAPAVALLLDRLSNGSQVCWYLSCIHNSRALLMQLHSLAFIEQRRVYMERHMASL